jgi:ABC-type amino acid transport substrate-binding protein
MSPASSAALAVALLIFAARLAAPASGAEALRVCLDANAAQGSMHDGTRSDSFDVAVAQVIARRLGRNLAVQWFKTELDEDSSTKLAANALLSDRLCQLVGGYPLVESALARPGARFAKLPDHEGAKPSDRRRSVELGTLVPSRAYQFAALTIVLGAAGSSARITDLSQLDGMKLGVEGATLADAVLMLFGDGRFVNQITHVVPGRDELLPRLESGEYDAALVELGRFDAYRANHPETRLTASGYYPPVGFNMGFVGLSTDQDLIEKIDRAIAEMLESGEVAALAREAGVTYLPPHQPNVSRDITIADLRRN